MNAGHSIPFKKKYSPLVRHLQLVKKFQYHASKNNNEMSSPRRRGPTSGTHVRKLMDSRIRGNDEAKFYLAPTCDIRLMISGLPTFTASDSGVKPLRLSALMDAPAIISSATAFT